MKVLNITMHAINNYGSVLQAYATQAVIESLGYECETLDFIRETAIPLKPWQIIVRPNTSLRAKVSLFRSLAHNNKTNNRTFSEFRKRYLHTGKEKYIGDKSLYNNPPKADIYCAGSDQVWNPIYQKGIPGPYLLDFVDNGSKKISFSSSFGVNEIPSPLFEGYKSLLSQFSSITVRETSAVRILESMGIKSSLVLDPTLMMDKTFWEGISTKRKIEEDYMLIYNVSRSDGLSKYAKEYAKRHKLKLFRICGDFIDMMESGKSVVSPSPEEFLSLIQHASCIITNSFHAVTFSLLFNKQFIVFLPKRYTTRIENILKIVGLEKDAIVRDMNDYSYGEKTYDYNTIDKILQKERELSINALRCSLSQ